MNEVVQEPAPGDYPCSRNTRFVEGVDHLRGLAAVLVLFHHSYWLAVSIRDPSQAFMRHWPKLDNPLFAPLLETHFALAIFFVISGFVLTLATYKRQIRFGGYLRNRGLRVLPLVLTALLLGIAIFPSEFTLSRFIVSATLFGNVRGAALQVEPVNTALWAVGVELQFYLVLPLLVAILGRQGMRPFLFMIALMAVLRLVGFFLLAEPDVHGIFGLNYWFLIPGRLDQFLLGMLAARFYLRWKEDGRTSGLTENRALSELLARILSRFPRLACLVSVALLFAWTYGLNQVGGAPTHAVWKFIAPTVEALVCVALLLSYVAAVQYVPRILARVFSFLGSMSFSIYVCHFMVVGLLIGDITHVDRLPGHSIDFIGGFGLGVHANAALNTFVLAFPAVLVLSYLLFNAIELPFMRLRGRYVIDPEADDASR